MSASCDCTRSGAELVPGAPGAACLVRPSAAEPCVPRETPPPRVPGDSNPVWGAAAPGVRIACQGPGVEAPMESAGRSSSPGLWQLGTRGSQPLQRWGGARLSISILSFSTCSSAAAPGSWHLRWPAPENAAKSLNPLLPRNSFLFLHPVQRAWRHSSQPLSLVSSLPWEPAVSWLIIL